MTMQRIATTVRLNRSVLQFDADACARLEQYLAESQSLLEGDPDPQEILADLEQAVADQCSRRLQPGQTIVSLAELEPALDEIGSVQSSAGTHAAPDAPRERPRRLEQITEEAVISGVCAGFARYFGFNVAALRVFTVLLFLLTGGGMLLVYFTLMLLMPYAPLAGHGHGGLPRRPRARPRRRRPARRGRRCRRVRRRRRAADTGITTSRRVELMEDAGFIIGSYLLTFATVGLLAWRYVRSGRKLADQVPDGEKTWL